MEAHAKRAGWHGVVSAVAAVLGLVAPSHSAEAAAARRCAVNRLPFTQAQGFHHHIGLSNEGGSCTGTLNYTRVGRNGEVPILPTSGNVVTPPQHGTVVLHFDPTLATYEYTPQAGYTGPDRFELRAIPAAFPWVIDVDVAK